VELGALAVEALPPRCPGFLPSTTPHLPIMSLSNKLALSDIDVADKRVLIR
jgi:hypothetical protein